MYRQPDFLAFDFYCGAGGTTRGLLDAGGYVVAGIDKDRQCRTTYQRNNRNGLLDRAEPRFLTLDLFPASADKQGQQHLALAALAELIPRYRLQAPDVPLLFAICAPCQAFTKFVQRHLTDPRARARARDRDLLAQTIPFIETFRPELVLSENVASIHRPRYGSVWADFQSNLRSLGYVVSEGRICASRFGVPQHRRRSVLLAHKSDKPDFPLSRRPVPHHDPNAALMTVAESIGHFPAIQAGETSYEVPNHVCRDLTEVNRQRLMSVRPGEPNFAFAETPYGDLTLPCHRRLPPQKRGFGDVYTRIHPSRPSPTITTRFLSVSNGRFGHYDEAQVRGLSLREGAALQSFPDDYRFYADGMHAVAKMIGNAVPPKLSAYMTSWLLGQWRDLQSNRAS